MCQTTQKLRWWVHEGSRSFCQPLIGQNITILASDWSRHVTWPAYRVLYCPRIGHNIVMLEPYWSWHHNSGLWLVIASQWWHLIGHGITILASDWLKYFLIQLSVTPKSHTTTSLIESVFNFNWRITSAAYK